VVCDIDNNFSCKPYNIFPNQALIFSAINQIHWRPKIDLRPGEFCDIITFSYSREKENLDLETESQKRFNQVSRMVELSKLEEMIFANKKYREGYDG
jgi:hypothetical protein